MMYIKTYTQRNAQPLNNRDPCLWSEGGIKLGAGTQGFWFVFLSSSELPLEFYYIPFCPINVKRVELKKKTNTSSSLIPLSSCFQSFPASGSFLMSQFFASGGQSMGVQLQHQSFHEYSGLIYFRMDWLNLLAVQGTLESSPTPQFKSINSSVLSFL